MSNWAYSDQNNVPGDYYEGQTISVTTKKLEAFPDKDNQESFNKTISFKYGKKLRIVKPFDLRGSKKDWEVVVVEDPESPTKDSPHHSQYLISRWLFPISVTTEDEQNAVEAVEVAQNEIGKITDPNAKRSCDEYASKAEVEKFIGVHFSRDEPSEESDDCKSTVKLDICKEKIKKCNKSPLKINPHTEKLMEWTLSEVNSENKKLRAEGKLEVNPALVLSFITAESSGDPLKSRPDGGEGLGQFTFPKEAKKYGLDYDSKRPKSSEAIYDDKNIINKKDENSGLYSIWSPKGSIRAEILKLADDINVKRYIRKRDSSGKVLKNEPPLEISWLYKRNDLQIARYMAGIYNRGNRVTNSIEEFYRQHHKLPIEYGQAWNTIREKYLSENKNLPDLLYKQCINRCHVEKIAGLCEDTSKGYFSKYSSYFEKSKDGTWTLNKKNIEKDKKT